MSPYMTGVVQGVVVACVVLAAIGVWKLATTWRHVIDNDEGAPLTRLLRRMHLISDSAAARAEQAVADKSPFAMFGHSTGPIIIKQTRDDVLAELPLPDGPRRRRERAAVDALRFDGWRLLGPILSTGTKLGVPVERQSPTAEQVRDRADRKR